MKKNSKSKKTQWWQYAIAAVPTSYALFIIFAEAAVTVGAYKGIAYVFLAITMVLGFMATFKWVNGIFDWFEARRPLGETPDLIDSVDRRWQARRR